MGLTLLDGCVRMWGLGSERIIMFKLDNKGLCEKLGIKPKTIMTECSNRTKCDGCCRPCACDDSLKYDIYPDLSQPINFVKLLNLLYNCKINGDHDFDLASMVHEVDSYYFSSEKFETFEIEWLAYFDTMLYKKYDNWDMEFLELIKSQIKKINFIYES